MDRQKVVELALEERKRQDELWGTDFRGRSHGKWFRIAMEEIGETIKAVNDHDLAHAQEELIQSIATLMSWAEHGEF